MSLSQAKVAETRGRSEAPPALRPFWLRPAAILVIVGLHALLFLSARTPNSLLTPLDAVEVALEPMGDSPEDQAAVAEIAPSEPPPARAPAAAAPEPEQAELTALPPQVIAPDAIPLAVEEPPEVRPKPVGKPTPVTRPRPRPEIEEAEEDEDDDRPTPAELRAQRSRAQAASDRRQAQEGRQAARRGVAHGAPAVGGMSHASYAALLAAEIRRRTFYPAAARASGESGSVGVAFTVGPSGRVGGLSITSSSGNAALDGAARSILRAIQTPPPPSGYFSASTSIRFHLN